MTAVPFDRFVAPADPRLLERAWCDHLAPMFLASVAKDADLTAAVAMTTWHMADIIVGEAVAPAQRLVRDYRMIARQGLDHVLLQFHEAGASRVDTDRGGVDVLTRQVLVLDLSQPVRIASAAVRATNVLLPRRLVGGGIGLVETLHGRAFDYETAPVRRLFHAYLRGVIASVDSLERQHLPGVSQAASKLCGACFSQEDGQRPSADADINVSIRQHISRHLVSPDLGIDTITAHFGLSRATLYRLFETDGGVINYIRDRRLMRAMRLLTEGGLAGRPRVSTVAYATGFSDEKTFSRAFKRRFGFVPREADMSGGRILRTNDNASVLFGWIKGLVA